MICARCKSSDHGPGGRFEKCWYCDAPLCWHCYDDNSECGHPSEWVLKALDDKTGAKISKLGKIED